MLRVVVDAGHDVGAAEPLRIFERRVGDQLAGLQVEQPQHDRRRAQSIAMPWIGPVERSTSSPSMRMRSPSRVTAGSSVMFAMADRQFERVPLDAHLAAAHRVAANFARRRRSRGSGTTGESYP